MIRLVLVDDHELIRQGLRRAFDRAGGFEIVADVGSFAEAQQVVDDRVVDVVVTDVRLPDGSGIDLVKTLRSKHMMMGLVVVTMYAGDDTLLAAMEAGASALVSKDAPADEVVAAAMHATQSPRTFIARNLAQAISRRREARGPQLTRRENEILQLLTKGMSINEISRQLYISDSTTKTHVAKIYDKLGAANRAQAVMKAVQFGLVAQTDSGLPPNG